MMTLDEILLADLRLGRWLGANRKKWLTRWARSERGRDQLSDLLSRGYSLNYPPPISGGARNFDATDDMIDRGADDATLDVADTDSCALQALASLDAVGTVIRTIAGKKSSTGAANAGYHLTMSTAEVVQFICADGVDGVVAGTGAISAATWIGCTGILRANAAADDDAILYRDGTLNQTANSIALGSLENALPFRAGANSAATPAQFWDGNIAYVRFWKKVGAAWTQREIDNIVESHNRLYLPQNETMELQWVLWDEAASPATQPDYTENDFAGTYTGTTFVADPRRVTGPGGGAGICRAPTGSGCGGMGQASFRRA